MIKVANIFVNIPVKSIAKAYSYAIPDKFSFLQTGWRVFVPFGNRKVEGFIVNISAADATTDLLKLKEIIDIVDEEPWFTDKMLKIAKWMADFYLCSFAEAMRLFMPGKTGLQIKPVYLIGDQKPDATILQVNFYVEVYNFIMLHQPVSLYDLRKNFPEFDIDAIIVLFLQHKFILKDYSVKKNTVNRYEKIVELIQSTFCETDFSRKPAQKNLLQLLQNRKSIPISELKAEKITMTTIQALVQANLIRINERRIYRDSYEHTASQGKKNVILTGEQETAVNELIKSIEQKENKTFLLYGITGSGKTQVYIEAANKVRQAGQHVIVLVPEIALTGQLVSSFKYYFKQDIIVLHSRLSISERNDAIRRIKQNEIGIVIGARSALFTPIDHIGLIILDEEQDASYKQDESPRYHTRDVAQALARIHKAILVLGSATPSVETFARAQNKEYTMLTLSKRIGNIPMPQVTTVDMRAELKQGNRNIISRALKKLIEETIAKKEQVIIMLNRRGFSTFVMCRSCGHVIVCKDCTLPLVYHQNGKLQCHHCDSSDVVPDVCPKCGSRYIKYFGTGTERLEHELRTLVPEARIIRMDRDTTTKKFAHAEILTQFKQGLYDILLGTQMVAKGHDIPNVTAVGIISADSSLNVPDFRSAERCFALITQTAGRAGRGDIPGKVIIQTYNPEHYAVHCGMQQDYLAFYKNEIVFRKQLFYPPYSNLIKMTIQNADEQKALAEATEFVKLFRSSFKDINSSQIIGPAPAMISNLRGLYRINLLIKTNQPAVVKKFMVEQKLHIKNNIMLDINPLNTM
ncbi:primosomal protein N' [Propionispira raffinosivorans]|uniref:primosomal protein N' n=1 Tax=Propionispira raffinosivorans TaxID=86959 RepID=UPI000374C079|nr:primosomal protein N' [Propionispira raffinosivorans]